MPPEEKKDNFNQMPQGEFRAMKKDLVNAVPTFNPNELGDFPVPPEPKFDISDLEEIKVPPIEEVHSSNKIKIIIFASIGVLLFLISAGGVYLWFNMSGFKEGQVAKEITSEQSQEEVSLEPSPTEDIGNLENIEATNTPLLSLSPTPSVSPESVILSSSLIKVSGEKTVEISKLDRVSFSEAINATINATINVKKGETIRLLIKNSSIKTQEFLSLNDFKNILAIKLPEDLEKNFKEWSLYLYRPQDKEVKFCGNLKITDSGCGGYRLSLVFKVDSLPETKEGMKNFEKDIMADLKPLILADAGNANKNFQDATYKNIKLRFQNYSLTPSDTAVSIASINYSTVKSGKNNLLIISTSRLSFYSLLDKIVGK